MNIELDISQLPLIELNQLIDIFQKEKIMRTKADNNTDLSDDNFEVIINKNWTYLNKNSCYNDKFIFRTITMLNIDDIKHKNKRKKSYMNWSYKVADYLIPIYTKLNNYIKNNHLTYERDQLLINSFFCECLNIYNIDIINTIQVKIPYNLEDTY